MLVSGVRSSWLTMPRNSARSLSSSCSGVMSCTVMTTESISPVSVRMGVALTTAVTLLPSGASMMISSARTVSFEVRALARGSALLGICWPSALR